MHIVGSYCVIPLIGATAATVPLVDPALFGPTIDLVMEHHVKPGHVHEPDFYFFRDIPRNAVFCDVGANLGLSVLSVAATGAQPIMHSFEINPALFPKLRSTAASYPNSWQLHEYGLAESSEDMWLYIVRADKIYILGEATLRLDFLQEPNSITRLLTYSNSKQLYVGKLRAKVRRFDELGIRADYMKIDAEGAEATVIRGMRDTLASCRPIIMVENGAMAAVDQEMSALGFETFSYHPSAHILGPRLPGGGQNTFYVHAARLDELKAAGRLTTG